ncbi:MAG: MATE family efflux transporter [Clostridia bacterium]|nr:MATE family efflux transporter [Clostridia bacterium]
MLNAPVKPLVMKLAVPTIISMLITNIYNLVDTAFIGTLGTSASGAVGVVFGYMAILQACGFMFGQGSGILMSRALGAGDREQAKIAAASGFYISMLMGLFIAAVTAIWLHPIVMLLGSTVTIAPYAETYIGYILIAAPAMIGSFSLNNLLRFEGRAKLGMIGLLAGSLLNIAGDALFIFGFKMGIAGAGLSTCISQYTGLLILLVPYLARKTIVGLDPRKISNSGRHYATVVHTGLPSLIRQGLSSIATIILNSLAGGYGDAAVSAMSIAGRVSFIALGVALGIGQGFQPISGFAYGAKKYKRLRDAFFFTFSIAEAVMFVLLLIIFIFAPSLVQLFRDDPQVVEIGSRALRFQCIAVVMQPFSVTANMMFQSIGRSKEASFMAMLRSGLYYIPSLLILPLFLGLTGIECAQMVSDILTTLTCIPFVVRFMRETPEEDQVSEIDRLYGGA